MQKKSEKDCQIEKGIFGLEITTTQRCNFACSYCFEREHVPGDTHINAKILIKKIKEFIESEFFKEHYSGIKLILWGGEPTMNMSLCKALFESTLSDDPRVCFFIYTNGSTVEHLLPTFKRLNKKPFIKNDPKKLTIQLSYDGNPIHDNYRKDKKGERTSPVVMKALHMIHKNEIEYGLKSTMPWDAYCYLSMVWWDFYRLHELYGKKIRYAMTPDYYNVDFDKNIVEEELIRVAQAEYKFYKKHGRFLSNIFKSRRAFCATGKSMATIDTNGDIYYCHGCIYSERSKDLRYSNIFDEDFINSIEKAHNYFGDTDIEPEECKECISSMCLRCNVRKFEESEKSDFRERWYDHTAQKKLCEYFKLVGKIGSALRLMIREE